VKGREPRWRKGKGEEQGRLGGFPSRGQGEY